MGWGAGARGSLLSLVLCLFVTSESNKLHSLLGVAVQSVTRAGAQTPASAPGQDGP